MNVERLLRVMRIASAEMEETGQLSLLDALSSSLTQMGQQPQQTSHAEKMNDTRQRLHAVLPTAGSNDFTVEWRQALDELGALPYLGENLLDRVESVLTAQEINPTTAGSEIGDLAEQNKTVKAQIDQAIEALEGLGFVPDTLAPGDFELTVVIPRQFVSGELQSLGAEFLRLERIILPFTELTQTARPPTRLRSISSTDFTVFLDVAGDLAALLARCLDMIYEAYDRIKEMRKIKHQMDEIELPEATADPLIEYANSAMAEAVTRAAENVIAEFAESIPENREGELKLDVRNSLSDVAYRIDHQFSFDIRFGEVDDDEEEGEDTEARVNRTTVLEYGSRLGLANPDGQPILELPPTTGNGDEAAEQE